MRYFTNVTLSSECNQSRPIPSVLLEWSGHTEKDERQKNTLPIRTRLDIEVKVD